MKPKYTAGPWSIETTEDSHFILSEDSAQIAYLDAVGPYSSSVPNARLIAACPDMFEALVDAYKRLVELGEAESNDLLLPRIKQILTKVINSAIADQTKE